MVVLEASWCWCWCWCCCWCWSSLPACIRVCLGIFVLLLVWLWCCWLAQVASPCRATARACACARKSLLVRLCNCHRMNHGTGQRLVGWGQARVREEGVAAGGAAKRHTTLHCDAARYLKVKVRAVAVWEAGGMWRRCVVDANARRRHAVAAMVLTRPRGTN